MATEIDSESVAVCETKCLRLRDEEEDEEEAAALVQRGCDWECEVFTVRISERRGAKRELSDGFTKITGSLSRRLPIATHYLRL